VLILLLLTSATLITVDSRAGGGGVTGSLRDGARDAIAPVQRAVDDTFSPVTDWWDGVTKSADIKRENARLRRELEQARGDAAEAKGALRENRDLKRLNKLPFVGDLQGVTAEVVEGSPGNFESTVGIDKGTDDGIAVGQPVVAGDGLVGRITQASRRRATVQLLTDPDAGVAVKFQQSGTLALASGRTASDTMSLSSIQRDVPVKIGEIVSTAGQQNAAFPSGIPVGKVVAVRRNAGNVQKSVTVRPLVDFDSLSFVRVLRWPPKGGS
jgi:rod shape-determining protein MreC